jgi:hypothetical protein
MICKLTIIRGIDWRAYYKFARHDSNWSTK